MRLRRPEPRPFALSLGGLVGLAGFLTTPRPWPTDPVLGLAVGACVGVLAWAAVEQVPDALDRAVEARAHWLLGSLGLLPAAVTLGPVLLDGRAPHQATAIRALVFAVAALVAASVGNAHRGTLLLRREQVDARVTAVESRRRMAVLRVVAAIVPLYVLSLAIGDTFSAGSVVGSIVGILIGTAFTGTGEYELVALDDHLLFRQGDGRGATAVPWRRLRNVTVDGDTLRIARGLPYPTVYTVDLSEVEDRRGVLEAFRSYPTLH